MFRKCIYVPPFVSHGTLHAQCNRQMQNTICRTQKFIHELATNHNKENTGNFDVYKDVLYVMHTSTHVWMVAVVINIKICSVEGTCRAERGGKFFIFSCDRQWKMHIFWCSDILFFSCICKSKLFFF